VISVKNLYIIGHGHGPENELRETEDSFEVFDLSGPILFSYLNELMQKLY